MPQNPSAQSRRRYRFGEFGHSSQTDRAGMHLLRKSVAEVASPQYDTGPTTIRIFPAKNPENPAEWDPYRLCTAGIQFGDWIRKYPAVKSFGNPPQTFLVYDPSEKDPEVEGVESTPPYIVYNAIYQAKRRGQDRPGWANHLEGGSGSSPLISRPKDLYFVQGCIMQSGGQINNPPQGFGQSDKPVVIMLTSSAALAMIAEFSQLRQDWQQYEEGDWENIFVHGDPVCLETGRFVTFYTLKHGDPRAAATAGSWQQQPAGYGGQWQRHNAPIGYGAYVEPAFGTWPARLAERAEIISSRVLPWDEILYFPTIQQQAHMIADKLPWDVIEYAFADYPDWIPEAVRRRGVGQAQMSVPPMPPMPTGGAGPAQHPYAPVPAPPGPSGQPNQPYQLGPAVGGQPAQLPQGWAPAGMPMAGPAPLGSGSPPQGAPTPAQTGPVSAGAQEAPAGGWGSPGMLTSAAAGSAQTATEAPRIQAPAAPTGGIPPFQAPMVPAPPFVADPPAAGASSGAPAGDSAGGDAGGQEVGNQDDSRARRAMELARQAQADRF